MVAVYFLLAGVMALNFYALTLVLLRAPLFRARLFRPMVVNIGLSVAPGVVLALVVFILDPAADLLPAPADWLVWGAGALVWLLLLPNAAYLITELNFTHRHKDEAVPLWYDIVLTLTLAVSGAMNALLNVVLAQLLYVFKFHADDKNRFDDLDSWLMSLVVLTLVAFGVYLGRYIRVNSWDVRSPVRFLRRLLEHFRSPAHAAEALGFTVTHMGLLAVLYLIVAAPVMASNLGALRP